MSIRSISSKQFTRKDNLRIASIQFSPIHSQPRKSADLVERIIKDSNLKPNELDLLILPELALTGYVFQSENHINNLLENVNEFQESVSSSSTSSINKISQIQSSDTTNNISLELGSKISKTLNSHVVIGFPEKRKLLKTSSEEEGNERRGKISSFNSSGFIDCRPKELISETAERNSQEGYNNYNSAALFDRNGDLINVFSKHFLFKDDESWSEEEKGFEWIDIPDLGRICVAICMDLNPYQFESSFENFELSTFCSDQKVDLLVMPMAWLLSSSKEENKDSDLNGELESKKPCVENINYWAWRLEGIWGEKNQQQNQYQNQNQNQDSEEIKQEEDKDREVIFVASNRIGTEGESTFGGSSCALKLIRSEKNGKINREREEEHKPELLGFLGKNQEGILKIATG